MVLIRRHYCSLNIAFETLLGLDKTVVISHKTGCLYDFIGEGN